MSRASAFRPEFGLLAAGPVARSLIGRMHSRARAIGPVAAVSLRVASRIANSLAAGSAVRSPDELEPARCILFYSPPEHVPVLLEMLTLAKIAWDGKCLVFCEVEMPPRVLDLFRQRGASVATILRLTSADTAVIESDGASLGTARRIALDASLKSFEIPAGRGELFAAALTICNAGLTPVIDRAAMLFRQAGLRDTDAARLAARMVSQTANDYSHSGKQSWAWHVRAPDPERLAAEVAAVPADQRSLLSDMIQAGFVDFGKHPELASQLKGLLDVHVKRPV